MKVFSVASAMFLLGAGIGFGASIFLLHPLASAVPSEILAIRLQFAFGCGVLFAASACFGATPRWIGVYLLIGIVTCAAAIVYFRAIYGLP